MSTFLLVHGAFHGAWCWDLLRPELERAGHRTIAVDLPCDDPAAGNVRYAEVAMAAVSPADEDLVVVGHSLAGLTVPLIAAARPVRLMVFLNAFMPRPGEAFTSQFEEPGIFPPTPEETWPLTRDDGLLVWPPERVIPALYADAPADLARWAAGKLRPQSRAPHSEVCPLGAWPEVPSAYVLSTADTAVGAEWARAAARTRLGVTAAELRGGHMSMLVRPAELADLLLGFVR